MGKNAWTLTPRKERAAQGDIMSCYEGTHQLGNCFSGERYCGSRKKIRLGQFAFFRTTQPYVYQTTFSSLLTCERNRTGHLV